MKIVITFCKRPVAAAVTILLVHFTAGTTFSQEAAVIPGTEVIYLYSSVVENTFVISVAVPAGYDESEESYPVIYVTDPFFVFGSAVESARLHAIDGRMPPAILVGIGYSGPQEFGRIMLLRSRNFSPTEDPDLGTQPPVWAEHVEWGGADAFRSFIREDLIPFVEGTYRVTDDRTYVGHSGGGVFWFYILFDEPELFARYHLSGAPLSWYDAAAVFDYEAAYAAEHTALPARVFLST